MLRKSIGIGLAFQYSRNLLPAVPMARGAFIALVRQLEIATAEPIGKACICRSLCSIFEQGVGVGNGGNDKARTCGAYVYDCFVTFVLTASTDNVSYSKLKYRKLVSIITNSIG